MPYILGTAGHVDHGKTALVRALTGTETSHLPEEKRRGMTIELGFAALTDAEYGTVGIVDVPGHERFIRNMVAGTWGLDAAMLIVAADDGWMQMSGDHLRVLKAMHVDSVLLTITKSDLVDAAMLELIVEDAQRHCGEILGRRLPSVAVSALSGAGIDDLKKAITVLLRGSKKQRPYKSILYVDRAFVLKGVGTTITGTLRGGGLAVGDELGLYPGAVECRVKKIQNHYNDVAAVEPGSRAALNIKISEKETIGRGMLLAKNSAGPVLEGRELLVRIDEAYRTGGESEGLKNHAELEIALGSAHAIGSLHLNQFDKSLGRLSLGESLACLWNQHAVLISHGGSKILAACRVLAAFPSYNRSVFKDNFEVYGNRELPSWQSWLFHTQGYLEKSRAASEELSANPADVVAAESYWFSAAQLAEWTKKIMAMAQKSQAGFTMEELELPLPPKIKAVVFKRLCDEHKLDEDRHNYKLAGRSSEDLGKSARELLALALRAGTEGIKIDELALPQAKKDGRDLVKLGKLVVLDMSLHYHRDVYDQVLARILKDRKPGDCITIADVREASGLSRKFIIPILNLMEKDRKVRREGDTRIVL